MNSRKLVLDTKIASIELRETVRLFYGAAVTLTRGRRLFSWEESNRVPAESRRCERTIFQGMCVGAHVIISIYHMRQTPRKAASFGGPVSAILKLVDLIGFTFQGH